MPNQILIKIKIYSYIIIYIFIIPFIFFIFIFIYNQNSYHINKFFYIISLTQNIYFGYINNINNINNIIFYSSILVFLILTLIGFKLTFFVSGS